MERLHRKFFVGGGTFFALLTERALQGQEHGLINSPISVQNWIQDADGDDQTETRDRTLLGLLDDNATETAGERPRNASLLSHADDRDDRVAEIERELQFLNEEQRQMEYQERMRKEKDQKARIGTTATVAPTTAKSDRRGSTSDEISHPKRNQALGKVRTREALRRGDSARTNCTNDH